MPRAVCDVGYQVQVFTLGTAQQAIYCLDNNLYQIDILPLIETTYVICFGNLTFVEYRIYRPCMIFDI